MKLKLTLKDGQDLGYIQVRDNNMYYSYPMHEGTEFTTSEALDIIRKVSKKSYDVWAEVTLTTNKGRAVKGRICNEILECYLRQCA